MYKNPLFLSYSFANVAVVPLYHLDAFSHRTNAPLRITPAILAGIYTGTISMWNDPLLIAANAPNGQYLPRTPITVVARTGGSDANNIFLRYLALSSVTFRQQFAANGGGAHYSSYNFAPLQAKGRLVGVTENLFVDNVIIANDGTFGYFLQTSTPTANIASFCADDRCATPIVRPNDNGASIMLCMNDPKTIVNPDSHLYSYDLMVSSTPGCYPIVGSVDLSIMWKNDPATCTVVDASGESIVHSRVKLGSFLFNGSAIINPLQSISAAPASPDARALAYKTVCDLTCGKHVLGYDHCNYRDCSWQGGDFAQVVSECDPANQKRAVTYVLSTNSTGCNPNAATMPPAKVLIDCAYVYSGSSIASGAVAMCVIGVLVCAFVFYLAHKYSDEKVLRRSQLVFIYIFLVGAILMNLTVLAFYGPNSDSLCMLRVWAFNLSSTIMYAPLVMKLHRVEVFYRQVQKGHRRRNISDSHVFMQVFGILCVDILICLLWSVIAKPQMVLEQVSYGNVYAVVNNPVCSATINQPFEIAMVIWKAVLLAFGVGKAIQTWDVPEDVSEAKYFAVAIYNIAVVGSFTYFLSVFGTGSVETFVVLRCVGIFVSATMSTIVIMVPKLLVIQLNWTELLLGGKSSNDEDYSETPDMTTTPAGVNGVNNNNHAYNDGMGTSHRGERGGRHSHLMDGAVVQLVVQQQVAASSGSIRMGNRMQVAVAAGDDSPVVATVPLGPGGLPRLDQMAVPRPSAHAIPALDLPSSGGQSPQPMSLGSLGLQGLSSFKGRQKKDEADVAAEEELHRVRNHERLDKPDVRHDKPDVPDSRHDRVGTGGGGGGGGRGAHGGDGK